MPANLAKRWGRWFAFAWIAVSLGAALLPCREVLAAVAAHAQAVHSDCGHPADQAPDSGGDRKTKGCLNLSAPARVATGRLVAAGGSNPVHQTAGVFASSHILHTPRAQALSLRPAYRAATPPVAVYLRSSRLLI